MALVSTWPTSLSDELVRRIVPSANTARAASEGGEASREAIAAAPISTARPISATAFSLMDVQLMPATTPSDLADAERLRHARELAQRLVDDLRELPKGWDSYGGLPIGERAALASESAIASLLASGAPVPSVIPTASGGIQLEWHRPQAEFQILFPNGEYGTPAIAYFFDDDSGIEWEMPLSVVTHTLADVLSRFDS